MVAISGTRRAAAWSSAVRIGRRPEPRLFSDHRDRLVALRHGERRVGRNRCSRQRGLVGISLFMGGESTPSRAVVQSVGRDLRLNATIMKNEFNRAGPVLHLFLRYTQALITINASSSVARR